MSSSTAATTRETLDQKPIVQSIGPTTHHRTYYGISCKLEDSFVEELPSLINTSKMSQKQLAKKLAKRTQFRGILFRSESTEKPALRRNTEALVQHTEQSKYFVPCWENALSGAALMERVLKQDAQNSDIEELTGRFNFLMSCVLPRSLTEFDEIRHELVPRIIPMNDATYRKYLVDSRKTLKEKELSQDIVGEFPLQFAYYMQQVERDAKQRIIPTGDTSSKRSGDDTSPKNTRQNAVGAQDQVGPLFLARCPHGRYAPHSVEALRKYSGPYSNDRSVLGVFAEIATDAWPAVPDGAPTDCETRLIFCPTRHVPDPATPLLTKLSHFISNDWSLNSVEAKAAILREVWDGLEPRQKSSATLPDGSAGQQTARALFQNRVSEKFAGALKAEFGNLLDSDVELSKTSLGVNIRALTAEEMGELSKLCRCDVADVYKGTDPTAGTESSTARGKERDRGQDSHVTVSPAMVELHGPKSEGKAPTLAFTLQDVEYPRSADEPLGNVRLGFTLCRGISETVDATQPANQTFSVFLQERGLPEEPWGLELDSLIDKEWLSSPDVRKLCVRNNGPARKDLETRLGHAFAKSISERIATADDPISTRYLKPATYNRLGPQKEYSAVKTFPFSLIDKNGHLPRVTADNNRQLPIQHKRR